MKLSTILKLAAGAAAAWAFYRVVVAKRAGAPALPALAHPTVDPRVAGLIGHPELQQTLHGVSHFQ